MFQKTLIMLACAASLAGCGGGASLPPVGSAPVPPPGLAGDVQAVTRTVCAFVPTAATIAGIFAKGNAAVSTASQIANAICSTLALNPMTEGPAGGRSVPKVLGVPVKGAFVR